MNKDNVILFLNKASLDTAAKIKPHWTRQLAWTWSCLTDGHRQTLISNDFYFYFFKYVRHLNEGLMNKNTKITTKI